MATVAELSAIGFAMRGVPVDCPVSSAATSAANTYINGQ
jgi:hypothetical protein